MSASEAVDLFYATLPVAKLGVLIACLAFILPDFSVGGVLRSHIRPVLPLGLVLIPAWLWLCFVTVYVPEPYLVSPVPFPLFKIAVSNSLQDEVFHIPQAQKYCDGRWHEWDDKITTPPGLCVSLPLPSLLSHLHNLGTACRSWPSAPLPSP